MIAIVDYGAGNISSVKKALMHLGAESEVTSDPAVIAAADKIIVCLLYTSPSPRDS